MKRRQRAAALALAALLLHGCGAVRRDGPPRRPPSQREIEAVPEPVPQPEPRSQWGNPESYTQNGETYYVMKSADGYKERGKASWYGRKFHGRRTSSGEPYDMYALTAAHKTLPLPSYVRVTNVGNGKSLIVRVNDRGPFHSERIIDLSYACAVRLDIVGAGEAEVELEALTSPQPPTQLAGAYLEAGVFGDPINAVALREQIAALGVTAVEIRVEAQGDGFTHRVLVGPFATSEAFADAKNRLLEHQIPAQPVAP